MYISEKTEQEWMQVIGINARVLEMDAKVLGMDARMLGMNARVRNGCKSVSRTIQRIIQ